MNPLEMTKGVDFDLTGGSIQCIADRDGARVFSVKPYRRTYRVLAHDEWEAYKTAQDHDAEQPNFAP